MKRVLTDAELLALSAETIRLARLTDRANAMAIDMMEEYAQRLEASMEIIKPIYSKPPLDYWVKR